jgi:hypothetical protein
MPPPVAPPAPRKPIVIPDGEPSAAGLEMLKSACPSAVAEVRRRIDEITSELNDQLETARTSRLELRTFAKRLGRLLHLRGALEQRLGGLDPTFKPDHPPVAAEAMSMIVAVKRWQDRAELRVERSRLALAAARELAEVETQLGSIAERLGSGVVFGTPQPARDAKGNLLPGEIDHAVSGLNRPQHQGLRLLEAGLARRAGLKGTLTALGEDTGARAKAATTAVDAAGRETVLSAVLSAQNVPAAALVALQTALAELETRIERTDDESRAFLVLIERRNKLQADLVAATEAAERERQARAGRLLDSALGGDSQAIETVEAILRPSMKPVADALALARGSDPQLTATVGIIIGD